MGTILNKLIPNSLTASGSDGDGPSRIAQTGIIALIGMLFVSMLTGPAAAASVTGISADAPTYDSSVGKTTQYLQLTAESAAAGDTETITFDAGDGEIQNLTAQVSMSTAASVTGVTDNGDGTYDIQVEYNENISSSTTIDIATDYEVVSGGEATVSVAGTSHSTNFSYSEPTGTFEIGSISTSDDTSFENLSGEQLVIENSNGTEVVNTTTFSENYSTELASGEDYTVRYTADNYDESSQTVSISYNNTTTADLTFQRTQVDYEFTVVENGEDLAAFDISIFQGAESEVDFENDSAVASATVTDNDSNNITFAGLDEGKDYTVLVEYGENNNESYTYTFTADESADDDGDGVVSQTLDVAGDNSGFIGSVDNPFSGVMDSLPSDTDALIVTFVGGFALIVGGLFVVLWTLRGLRLNF